MMKRSRVYPRRLLLIYPEMEQSAVLVIERLLERNNLIQNVGLESQRSN